MGNVSLNPEDLEDNPEMKRKLERVNKLMMNNKDRIAGLEKKETNLQARIKAEVERAKNYARQKNVRMAKQCLLRKKQLSGQLDQIMNQKNNIEQINMKLDVQITNMEVFLANKQGNEVFQDINDGMDVEEVNEVMDDLRDKMADVDEVGQALGEGLGDVSVDDPDLEDEYDALTRETLDEDLIKTELPNSDLRVKKEEKKQPVISKEQDAELDEELGLLMADIN